MIALTLPVQPGQNALLRMNRWKRRKERDALAWQIRAQLPFGRPPAPPARATVVVSSYRIKLLDDDNLAATVKSLLDVLQPFDARRRPYGLGLIAGDDREHLVLGVRQEKVAHLAEQHTRVVIEAAAA